MVKDSSGHPRRWPVAQRFQRVSRTARSRTLTYFTSDPFELSVAIVIDTSMSDVALQKVNQTYPALIGAFSPYDEVALYAYSNAVSQVTDFTRKQERLNAALTDLKQVRGMAARR